MYDGPRRVELVGVDGSLWHLHGGRSMGREGVVMSGVKGLYHPVRKPRVQTPAFMDGAIPGIPKTDPQVTDLKVFSAGEDGIEWERIENRWWDALSDEEDFTLRVYNRAGTSFRELRYRVETWPDDDMDSEPEEESPWAIPLIAYRPGWCGQTLTSKWDSTDPSKKLRFVNPGNLPLYVELSLTNTGSQRWTVPDGIGGATVKLEQFPASVGDLFIQTDPFTLQLESDVESQIGASLLGLRFRNPIPPRTFEPVEVPISVTGGSGVAKAYMTPKWKRPW